MVYKKKGEPVKSCISHGTTHKPLHNHGTNFVDQSAAIKAPNTLFLMQH
jgi:hypothetical protein